MNIDRTTPNEREPRRFARRGANGEHAKRLLLGGLLTATTLAGGLSFASEVQATSEVWICHAVEGQGELKNGFNLIYVSLDGTDSGGPNDHESHEGDIIPAVGGAQSTCGVGPTFEPVVERTETPCRPGDETVTVTTTTTYYEAVFQNGKWEKVQDGDPEVEQSTRLLTLDEQAACAPAAKVVESEWTNGTYKCDETTVVQTRNVTTTPYTYEEGEWVLGTAVVTEETQTRQLDDDEFEPCPTTAPPADPPVQFEVASNTPIAPAAPAAPAQASAADLAATQLPSTGNSSWVTALIALVALAGGTGLVRLSRRPTD